MCLLFSASLGPQPILCVPVVQHRPVDYRWLLRLCHMYINNLTSFHWYLTLWDPQGEPGVRHSISLYRSVYLSLAFNIKLTWSFAPQQSITLRNMARFVTSVTIRRASGGEFCSCERPMWIFCLQFIHTLFFSWCTVYPQGTPKNEMDRQTQIQYCSGHSWETFSWVTPKRQSSCELSCVLNLTSWEKFKSCKILGTPDLHDTRQTILQFYRVKTNPHLLQICEEFDILFFLRS